jgi:carbonic anhydrase/acetyltransferase-like protein (isoleucine patch superfamily)
MEIKAVVLVGNTDSQTERWSQHPISCLEVLGKPVVDHVIDRLQRFGVDSVTLIAAPGTCERAPRRGVNIVTAAADQLWRSAETVFNLYAQAGAEIVVALRMGPYVEFDLEQIFYFHHERKNRVTRVVDPNGASLEICIIDGSRRNDAAFLFRAAFKEMRLPAEDYVFSGYVNHLREIADLRRLTQDALMLDCELRPDAEQIKPGVWVGDGVELSKDARLVAPCFIGAGAKVHSGAVVTRLSAIERNAEIDLGTVVEDSNILPLSYVGPGLDVCHAVLGYSKIASLPRNATVALCDPQLAAELSSSRFVRAVGGYAETVSRAAAAVITSFSAKRTAEPNEAANVEHASRTDQELAKLERSRAAAKAG